MATNESKPDTLARQARRREVNRKNEERKRRAAGIPPLGSSMKCERCPAIVPRSNGAQKYCAKCRKVVTRERRRIANDKYNEKHGRVKESPEKAKERNERYIARHPERRLQTNIRYREANRDKINAYSRAHAQTESRRIWLSEWQRVRRRTDPTFAINARMSAAIGKSLKGRKAGRGWESLVGYTVDDLMHHLERQFTAGMSWANFGQWHVDHVISKKEFVFTESSDREFIACWAMSNLRPLWSKQNLSKGSKRLFLI